MFPRILLGFFLLLAATFAIAQEADDYRMEFGAAIGGMGALNDANSKLLGQMKPSVGAFVRFTPHPRQAFKVSFNYGKTAGNVNDVSNFYPAQPIGTIATARKHHEWDGAVLDFNAVYELHFLPYGYRRSYLGLRRLVPYLQLGLGVVYGTAGKAFSPTIPLGVGLKYKLAPRWNLGVEWKMHFSLTDRLDNLEAPLNIATTGFKKKDHFGLTLLTLSYSLSPVCPTCNKDNR